MYRGLILFYGSEIIGKFRPGEQYRAKQEKADKYVCPLSKIMEFLGIGFFRQFNGFISVTALSDLLLVSFQFGKNRHRVGFFMV